MRTMNQSHNENRCCSTVFKTLLVGISCFASFQALGDTCVVYKASSTELDCMNLMLKDTSRGNTKTGKLQNACANDTACQSITQKIQADATQLGLTDAKQQCSGVLKDMWNNFCNKSPGTLMTVTDQTETIVNYGGRPLSCSKMPCNSLCQEQQHICSFYHMLSSTTTYNTKSSSGKPCEKAIQNPSLTNSGIKVTVCNETITIPTTSLAVNCNAAAASVNCTT